MLLALILALGIFSYVDRREMSHRNCRAIENLKAGQREKAQVAIDGEHKLLLQTLPKVQRQVIVANLKANQDTIDRYPPRKC